MQDCRALPGVAQVAIQQGKYAAMAILSRVRGHSPLPRFRYFDKGNLAVVGAECRGAAECGNPVKRLYGLARLGFHSCPISGRSKLTIQRLSAMDVDLHKR
jgi:NADH dehydrogenase FAD-containing subunit